jgi:hypothetical protein
MRPLSRSRSLIATFAVLALASACGSSGEQKVADMDEVLVRTASSVQGQAALANAGAQVSGPLSCTSSRTDAGVSVSCTGTTVDGKPVEVSGTATNLSGGDAVEGDFVGSVAGQQVFTSDCLGCAP